MVARGQNISSKFLKLSRNFVNLWNFGNIPSMKPNVNLWKLNCINWKFGVIYTNCVTYKHKYKHFVWSSADMHSILYKCNKFNFWLIYLSFIWTLNKYVKKAWMLTNPPYPPTHTHKRPIQHVKWKHSLNYINFHIKQTFFFQFTTFKYDICINYMNKIFIFI